MRSIRFASRASSPTTRILPPTFCLTTTTLRPLRPTSRTLPILYQQRRSQQPFSTTSSFYIKLTPDSSDPPPPKTEPHHSSASHPTSPTPLSDSEYHELADTYLNNLVLALEEKAESSSDGTEVEYAAGVLSLSTPLGTYILNKQPPNKQIWLSSPVSGPKRFDYVIAGAGQHEKQDSHPSEYDSEHSEGDQAEGKGRWVYLRDGTGLSDLLAKEVDVEVKMGGSEGEMEGEMVGKAGSGVSE